MKNTLKKAGILGLMIVCGAGLVFTNGATTLTYIQVNPDKPEHTLQLHSLFLGSGTDAGSSWIKANNNNLDILNGLIVGTGNRNGSSGSLIAVGGGKDNVVKGNKSGIGGGEGNKIEDVDNSAIGGGYKNRIKGDSATIAGGGNNTANASGVVAGGNNNEASNGVVLGGSGNEAKGENSLVMGEKSVGGAESFAWNDGSSSDFNAPAKTARIDTNSGVLIGTLNPIKGVALVVSGAIKLGKDVSQTSLTGEMKVDNGCIKVYDGKNWYSLGGKCGNSEEGSGCQFGKTYLLDGDNGIGYRKSVDSKCIPVTVKCNNGKLEPDIFPYCYKIGTDPEYYLN